MSTQPTPQSLFTVIIAAGFCLAGCATTSPVEAPANPWLASTTRVDAAPPPRGAKQFASPRRASLPGSVQAVRFTLTVPTDVSSEEGRAALAVGRALMAEGFQLTDGPGEAQIDIRAASKPSEAPNELVLAVVVTHEGGSVESLVGRVALADAARMASDVDDLAARLTSSVPLATFGRYVEQLHFAVNKPSPTAARPPEVQVDPVIAEAQAWKPGAVRRCRNARSETACTWIRDYLDQFPNGAHAQEARAMLGLPVPPQGASTVALK